jgi:hypothetical protein
MDHKRLEGETMKEYVKRSFQVYKDMRRAIRGIIYETNNRSHDVHKQPTNYLKSFRNRIIHPLINDIMGIDQQSQILANNAKLSF